MYVSNLLLNITEIFIFTNSKISHSYMNKIDKLGSISILLICQTNAIFQSEINISHIATGSSFILRYISMSRQKDTLHFPSDDSLEVCQHM